MKDNDKKITDNDTQTIIHQALNNRQWQTTIDEDRKNRQWQTITNRLFNDIQWNNNKDALNDRGRNKITVNDIQTKLYQAFNDMH